MESSSQTVAARTDEAEKRHVVLKPGTILWCNVCGSFAEAKAVGLLSAGNGQPPKELGSGGRRSQLNRLRAPRHPVNGLVIP